MRIEAIAIGNHPPEDVNVIVEVPVTAVRFRLSGQGA